MPKPQWLKDNEKPKRNLATCWCHCKHCDKLVHETKIGGKYKKWRRCNNHGHKCFENCYICQASSFTGNPLNADP